jgi:hypothetical protein
LLSNVGGQIHEVKLRGDSFDITWGQPVKMGYTMHRKRSPEGSFGNLIFLPGHYMFDHFKSQLFLSNSTNEYREFRNPDNDRLVYYRKNKNTGMIDSFSWINKMQITSTTNFSVKYLNNVIDPELQKNIIRRIETSVAQPKPLPDLDTLLAYSSYEKYLNTHLGDSKYLLVYYWWVACAPCREKLTKIAALTLGDSVKIICPNAIDDSMRLVNFTKKFNYPFELPYINPQFREEIGYGRLQPALALYDRDLNLIYSESGYDPAWSENIKKMVSKNNTDN